MQCPPPTQELAELVAAIPGLNAPLRVVEVLNEVNKVANSRSTVMVSAAEGPPVLLPS
jgi:hypothetical protein